MEAIIQLGYNDNPSTRDILLKILAEDEDYDFGEAALESARRLWGKDALEPDYALLGNVRQDVEQDFKEALERMRTGRCGGTIWVAGEEFRNRSHRSLQHTYQSHAVASHRSPCRPRHKGCDHRASSGTPSRPHGTAAASAAKEVATALNFWWTAWHECRQRIAKDNLPRNREQLDQLTPCLTSLLWAAGRFGVAQDRLITAANMGADDSPYRPLRLEAVTALTTTTMSATVLDALTQAALGNNPEIRTIATDAISRHSPERAKKLAEKLLSDRISFNRLMLRDGAQEMEMLRGAVRQVHYQGVALPHLISQADIEGLAAVAENASLPEATRLGAIEGLAKIPKAAAEAKLLIVARNAQEEEEVRKAAWRALRRLKRSRQRIETAAGEVKTS